MNEVQKALLELARKKDLSQISLREAAALIGRPGMSPGVLQHHFSQLQKKKLLFIDRKSRTQRLGSDDSDDRFYTIPILGTASCGPATQFADEAIEGYLTISKKSLREKGPLFALRATGNSMNRAEIPTLSGEKAGVSEGDYVIVERTNGDIESSLGKYVLSIINGLANIKKLVRRDYDYALLSETTESVFHPPIIIHKEDNFIINGRIIAVVKG